MIAPASQIAIRDLRSIDELEQLKSVEKEVWGMAEEDAMPLTLAIALKAAGNIFVGAFARENQGGKAAKEKSESDRADRDKADR
jgi:predicted GNAT superfamily acetyltransferase